MNDNTSRFGWLALGLIIGFAFGAGVVGWPRLQPLQPFSPFEPILAIGAFVTLWILVIAGAIKWLFLGRDRYRGRLADLPADFDDWHRRAHAQMEREAAARAGGTRP